MKQFLVLSVVLITISSASFAQTFEWAESAGNSISANATAVDAMPGGGCVTTGNFYNSATFGSETFYSQARDIFVARYRADGSVVWGAKYGGSNDDFGNALRTDAHGNIYVTGSFIGMMKIGKDSLVGKGEHDGFIAKFDSTGKPVWARNMGGPYGDFTTAVAPDNNGNVFVAGYFRDTISFGSITIASWSRGLMTMFLAKYDKNGNVLWAKKVGGSDYQSQFDGIGLDVDEKGSVYLGGLVHGKAIIDTFHYLCKGISDLFLAKFSPSGNAEWVRNAGAPTGIITVRSLRHDHSNGVVLCGTMTNTIFFDDKTMIMSLLGFADLYIAKYNDNGEFEWVQHGSGHGPKAANSLTIDEDNNISFAGTFNDTLALSDKLLTAGGKQTLVAASLTPKGDLRWIREGGRGAFIFANGIAEDEHHNWYISGGFSDTSYFGKVPMIADAGSQELYLTKLSPKSYWTLEQSSKAPSDTSVITKNEFVKRSKKIIANFSVGKGSEFVTIGMYDALGKLVESYTEEELRSGSYEVKLDLSSLPADSYYFRIAIGTLRHSTRIELE